jgi:hypothetical protein
MTIKELIESLSVYKPELKITVEQGVLLVHGVKKLVVHVPKECDK